MMLDLNAIADLPEVVGVALSEPSGALLEVVGDIDGEACGAVHSYAVMALSQAGEAVGLGEFRSAAIIGPRKACLVAQTGGEIVGVYVDPTKQFAPIEKKLQTILQK